MNFSHLCQTPPLLSNDNLRIRQAAVHLDSPTGPRSPTRSTLEPPASLRVTDPRSAFRGLAVRGSIRMRPVRRRPHGWTAGHREYLLFILLKRAGDRAFAGGYP